MKEKLLYIWQLPQNLVGLICLLIWKKTGMVVYNGMKIRICKTFPSGISLGNYIIVNKYPFGRENGWNDIKHEYGHHLQSLKLGCLYLLVIGIPSLLGNIYDRIFHTKENGWTPEQSYKWYYNQPWEKWADRLGDVKR